MTRRSRLLILIAALALTLGLPRLVAAGEIVPYDKQAFTAAQEAGKSIVVFVTASWCPNCRKQQPLVDALSKDKAFASETVFVIDYDSDKAALRDFDVRMQSTLIAFKGKAERMRSTAVTDADAIRSLFQAAL